MSENNPNNAAPPDEELVAYLDGELDADAVRRIEALLASDAEVRRRLQSLERTWDLLDELDQSPAGEPFTRSTLEMVAVAARDDLERSRTDAPRGRWRRRFLFGVVLAAAAAAGFFAVVALAPDPNRELLDDLPVLENLDEYRQAQSIEFLRKLRQSGLFDGAGAEGTTPAATPTMAEETDSMVDRRRRVESMSLEAKRELQRSAERFAGLAPEERQRLRNLHENLHSDLDADRLRRIMHGYCEWLNSLDSYSRMELAEMTPDNRVASVKRRLEMEKRREGARRPGGKDMGVLREWMAAFVARHEAALLATLPEEQRKQISMFKEDQRRRQMMLMQLSQRWQTAAPGRLPPVMTEADLANLRKRLSAETRKRLEDQSPDKQWQLVHGWLLWGWWHPGDGRRPGGPQSRDDDERLAEFFEKGLSDEERDRLLAMPGEEMQRELQQMFINRVRMPKGPGGHPDAGRHNNRPGGVERPMPKKSGAPGPTPAK